MKRVSLSGSEKSIQAIWAWYKCQSELSLAKKNHLLDELRQNLPPSDSTFSGLTTDEIEDFFNELDYLAMLDMLAATEAAIRVDYLERVYNRRGGKLSRDFRRLYKDRGNEVRLEEDILNAWKENEPGITSAVGDFNGALKLRHWLAHGRYWTPKFGMNYSPSDVFDISDKLLEALGVQLARLAMEMAFLGARNGTFYGIAG